jgi:hypothetical protein
MFFFGFDLNTKFNEGNRSKEETQESYVDVVVF